VTFTVIWKKSNHTNTISEIGSMNINFQKFYFVQILCFWILSIVSFHLKHRPIYISKNNVSETGFCLRLQAKYTQMGPIDKASPYLRRQIGHNCLFADINTTVYIVQKHSICTNVPSSQTFRLAYFHINRHKLKTDISFIFLIEMVVVTSRIFLYKCGPMFSEGNSFPYHFIRR
jgi:hypothetical protein